MTEGCDAPETVQHDFPDVMHPRHDSTSRMPVRSLYLISVLVIALMAGFAGISLWQSRMNHESRVETDLENLARVLEQYIHSTLHEIDLTLQTAADEFNHQMRTGGLQEGNLTRFLKDHQDRLPQIISLRITDATGTVRYGEGLDPTKPVNVADRDYFQKARDNPGSMIVTLPVFARISQKWVIPMARSLANADGSFAGIVYANITLDHLHHVFSTLKLGESGTVTLFSDQRLIYTRYPPPREGLEKTIGFLMKSPQIIEMMGQGRTSATYSAVSSLDHTRRTFAYRKAGGYPVYVMAGLAQEDYLTRWWREVWMTGSFLSVFVFVILGATFLLTRAWRQQEAIVTELSLRDDRLNRLVAELRQSQGQLKVAELRYRTLFELSPDAILVLDPETIRPLEFNRAAYEQLGYTFEEFSRLSVADIEARESSEEVREHADRLVSSGRDDFETMHRRKNGTLRHVFVTALPVRIGEKPAIFAIYRDITEFKRVEADLRENEHRLREITASLAEGLFVTDRRGHIAFINPAALLMTGFTEEAALGADSHLLLQHHADSSCDHQECALHMAMEQRQVIRQENSFFARSDGSSFPVALIAAPILRDGEVRGAVTAFHDITERRRHETELHLAKESAEAANRSKSEFLANMSHEIRTPINAIMGLTQLAMGMDLSPKLHDYLEKVFLSSRSLLGIINDILDFSKIEAGRLDLDAIDFDLEQVLESVNNLFAARTLEKNIELFVEVRPEVPCYLHGDPLRFGQIINNLVGNAVKFTETGEVRVVVDCGRREAGRVELGVEVRDTGIGMPPGEIERLFRPFHQVDGSITRRYGGTGLGLAITRNLVEKMEGRIEVESVPGQGSCFRFHVWLLEPVRIKPAPHPHDRLAFRSVLVVDDSATSREILRTTLEKWGLCVTESPSGAEALALLRAGERPDLLLVDLLMPGMDGVTLLRNIEGEIADNTMAVILMSASLGNDELVRESADVRKHAIVAKPITPSGLFDALMTAQGTEQRQTSLRGFDPGRWGRGLRGARVLLVEDNAINQQVAMEFLQLMGIEVTCADNGREAIAALQRASFDLILMDLQMPDMDGFEATRIIRREESWRGLPIIAMTAAAMTQDRKRCLAAGMNEHVAKPIDPERLAEVLRQWLPGREETADAEMPPLFPTTTPPPDSPPGFDLAQAVKPLGGNLGLWRRLAGRFADDFADTAAELSDCITRQDRAGEERLVHRLRGVAGNMGAMILHARATDLERLLRENGDPEPARERFRAALEEALASARLARGEEETVSVSFDPEQAERILTLIAEHIAARKFVSTRMSDDMRSLFADSPLSGEVAILLRHLDQFDFDAAGEQLRRVRERQKAST